MKTLAVAGVLAILWFGPARSDDKASDTHDAIVEEMLKSFEKFTDILITIKDKKTADDAKPKLEATGKALAGLKKRADKLGDPTGVKKEELEKKFKTKMEAATKKMTGEFLRIATNVDGGQEIVKDISSYFATLVPKAKDKEKDKVKK